MQILNLFATVFIVMTVCGKAAVNCNAESNIHQNLGEDDQPFQTGEVKLEGGHQHRVSQCLFYHVVRKNYRWNVGKDIESEQDCADLIHFAVEEIGEIKDKCCPVKDFGLGTLRKNLKDTQEISVVLMNQKNKVFSRNALNLVVFVNGLKHTV